MAEISEEHYKIYVKSYGMVASGFELDPRAYQDHNRGIAPVEFSLIETISTSMGSADVRNREGIKSWKKYESEMKRLLAKE